MNKSSEWRRTRDVQDRATREEAEKTYRSIYCRSYAGSYTSNICGCTIEGAGNDRGTTRIEEPEPRVRMLCQQRLADEEVYSQELELSSCAKGQATTRLTVRSHWMCLPPDFVLIVFFSWLPVPFHESGAISFNTQPELT